MTRDARPHVIIDIETRPDRRLIGEGKGSPEAAAYLEEVLDGLEPPANYKKEEAISSWKNKQVDVHLDKMALHPTTGSIVVIGMTSLAQGTPVAPVMLSNFSNEAWLMDKFAETLREDFPDHRIVCGKRVREFDIPYLTARAAIFDVDLPAWWPQRRNWRQVADLEDIFGMTGTLSEWCRAFGIDAPDVSGKETLAATEEVLVEHCRQDMIATTTLFRRLWQRFDALTWDEARF